MAPLDVRGAPPTLPVFVDGTKNLADAALRVAVRRARRGPLRPGWSYLYEVATQMLRTTGEAHLSASGVNDALRTIRRIFHSVELQRAFAKRRARCREGSVAGVPGTWISPRRGRAERLVYYIHGGGYFFGSSRTHAAFLAELANAARADIFAVDYCLAPERRFPHALDEVHAVYRGLLAEGHDPARTIIAGDSAGGGMSVATLMRAREAGDPLPLAAVLLSPWVDLTATIERSHDHVDWLPPELLVNVAAAYLGETDPRHPHVSPIHGDLRGLPPMHIVAGGAEIFLPQIERFAEVARAADVSVTLDIAPHRVHVSHTLAPLVRESREAIAELGTRIRDLDAARRRVDERVRLNPNVDRGLEPPRRNA